MLPFISCLLANIKSSNRGIPKKKTAEAAAQRAFPKQPLSMLLTLHCTPLGVSNVEKSSSYTYTSEKRGASLSVI
jgi:hypothetical protein